MALRYCIRYADGTALTWCCGLYYQTSFWLWFWWWFMDSLHFNHLTELMNPKFYWIQTKDKWSKSISQNYGKVIAPSTCRKWWSEYHTAWDFFLKMNWPFFVHILAGNILLCEMTQNDPSPFSNMQKSQYGSAAVESQPTPSKWLVFKVIEETLEKGFPTSNFERILLYSFCSKVTLFVLFFTLFEEVFIFWEYFYSFDVILIIFEHVSFILFIYGVLAQICPKSLYIYRCCVVWILQNCHFREIYNICLWDSCSCKGDFRVSFCLMGLRLKEWNDRNFDWM